ncbi:MAG: TolC family protein [Muribaculaceae bacterium]|nr:TolC family protein [Muribaculaceae bacterium]
MKRIYCVAIMPAVLGSTGTFAITPQEAANSILSRNGDRLQISVAQNAKDLESHTLANAPDPKIEGDYMWMPEGVDNRWNVAIGYEMEWPGVYKSRSNLGKAMRDANAAEADAGVYEKYVEILKEIGTYLYAERRIEMMRHIQLATDSLHNAAVRATKGGQMSRLDLSKITLEQGRVNTLIANLEAEKSGSEGSLKTLNGGYDCTALLNSIDREWVMTPTHSLEEYLEEARTNPELKKAISDLEVADRNIGVAKAEGLPSISVGYHHDFEDAMHFNGATLGISIPLFSNRGKVKAAKAAKAVAEYQVNVSTDKVESEITALYDEVQLIDQALKVPMEVFSTTDYNTLLLKAYRGGELSLTDYLQERSWFSEAHLDLLELQYQREQRMWLLSLLCK